MYMQMPQNKNGHTICMSIFIGFLNNFRTKFTLFYVQPFACNIFPAVIMECFIIAHHHK
jgi:hypothetical protein